MKAYKLAFYFFFRIFEAKFENLNQLTDLKNSLTAKQYVELLKSIIKMLAAGMGYYLLVSRTLLVSQSQQQTPFALIALVGKIIMDTVTKVAVICSFLAIFDYFYQKYECSKSIKCLKKKLKKNTND